MQAQMNVHVINPKTGLSEEIKEGEDIPSWAEELITNPKVTGEGGESKPKSDGKKSTDVGEGPLAGRKVGQLRNVAANQPDPIDVSGAKNKDELLELLAKGGVTD